MPTEELKFEELLKEYVEVIESTDVEKLEEDNRIIKIDIERKEKEEKDIDARIEFNQGRIDDILSGPSVAALEYKDAIEQYKSGIEEAKAFKEKKREEIKKLEDRKEENNEKIEKANNIDQDVIKKAEEQTNKENEEIDKEIAKLKERRAKIGLKDTEGKIIQLTKEEKAAITTINSNIKELIKKKQQNSKDLESFKNLIAEAKKDKEAFRALRDRVKPAKEETKKEEPKKEEPKKEEPKKEEPKKEEPKKEEPKKEEPKKEEPKKEEPKKEEPKKEEPKKEEPKKEEPKKEEPKKEEPKKEEPKKEDPAQDNLLEKYKADLEKYKDLMGMYYDAFDTLGDLQRQYENGEIEYSVYEEQALYMCDRYKDMMKEYAKIKELYDKVRMPDDKFAGVSNEDLENQLKELDEEANELWQQGVHENTPDAERYHEILEEIKRIKEELQQRKENPLRGMSLEELEAKKRELYAKIGEQQEPDEYEFRTHKENGLEGYEEDEIDKGLREIREEIERRKPKNLEAPEEPFRPGMILEDPQVTPPPPPPHKNVPMRSGLQVYDDVLQEVGYVKGTKAIAAHDFIRKFNFFGLNRLVAAGIRLATGRKKEINRIVEILDDLQEQSPEDFELLINDFLLEDNDTRNIMTYKVNEIFLEAVEKKCQKDFEQQEPYLTQMEKELREKLEGIESQLSTAEGEEKIRLEQEYNVTSEAINTIHSRRETLEMRARRIREGREDKSYDRKNNIKGGLRANRNPDNREEIHELRELEDIRLQAIADGDETKEHQAEAAMRRYRASKTEYKYSRKGKVKISLGAFDAKEGEIKVITHQKNMAAELAGLGAMMLTTAGLSYLTTVQHQQEVQTQVDQAIQNAETQANNQIDAARQTIQSAQSSVTNTHVVAGQESLQADAIGVQAIGERVSAMGADFKISPNGVYPTLDAAGVARADQFISQANGFTPTGSNEVLKLADIFGQKAQLSGQYTAEALKDLEGVAQAYYAGGSHLISGGGVDHTITAALEQVAGNFANSNTTLYSGVESVLRAIGSMNPQQIQNIVLTSPEIGKNLWPILISAMPTLALGIQEKRESDKQKREEVEPKKENKRKIRNKPKKEKTKKTLKERITEGRESLREKIAKGKDFIISTFRSNRSQEELEEPEAQAEQEER